MERGQMQMYKSLDYKSCVCRNRVVDRLIEECINVIHENKTYNETLSIAPLNTISSDDCASCTLYVVLIAVFLTKSVIIGGVFVYFYYWRSKKDDNVKRVRFNPDTTHTLFN